MEVTGQLGSVMSESSSISLTYARLFLREPLAPEIAFFLAGQEVDVDGKAIDFHRFSSILGWKRLRLDPENAFLDAAQVHLHVPEGATPKDSKSSMSYKSLRHRFLKGFEVIIASESSKIVGF